MARLVLEKLVAGMRLERPVFNLHGVLLLKENEALTTKHLEMFRAWGIREADVLTAEGEQPQAAPEAEFTPEERAAAQATAAHRFRRVAPEANPVLAEIFRVAARHAARRLATQGRD